MIGGMRHRITIQAETTVTDNGGGFSSSWQDVAEVFARIAPLSGYERLSFGKVETGVSHRILIRHRPDVSAASRLVSGGKTYHIHSVINVNGDSEYMEILAYTYD